MKIRLYQTILSSVAFLAIATACNDDDFYMTKEQEAMIGSAVNFSTSISDPFSSRTTYYHNGSFNEDDMITIYRQYSNDGGQTFDDATVGYRVYSYQSKTMSGMNVALNTQWRVKVGKIGYEPSRSTFTQTEADSLTWDDGRTVRFGGWALSNLSGCLSNGSWGSFYPDFTMAGWVTASGPTRDIPLSLKHLGCRIAIVPKSGNQIAKVEVSTDYEDYMRTDNADSKADDEADICTEEEARARAAAVKAVYNKMCMPGGIDFATGLKAMSKAYYDSHSNVSTIEREEDQAEMITFGTKSADELSTQALRPIFNYNNERQYFITIPHDMSTENAGDRLTLPSYTRFRVYIRDVNNGDKNTSGYEGTFHIFALNDIKGADGTAAFADGLPLAAGYSYEFTVGYLYNRLTVTMTNNLSWAQQDLDRAYLDDKQQTTATYDYSWWTSAIDESIRSVMQSSANAYNPLFNISNVDDFIGFIRLVNGVAGQNTASYTLERGEEYEDETSTDILSKHWKWYKVEDGKKTEITKEEAEQDGFVFYHVYHPADGDNAAYYEEVVLDGAYSFYSNLVNRKFTVNLMADIDLNDYKLDNIGDTEDNSFLGVFNGNFHTISNVYCPSGYLFGYAGQAHADAASAGSGAVISNLVVESDHKLTILKKGTAVKMLGIRMMAENYKSAFADELLGTSYLVGCSNTGDATVGLVGKAEKLSMYGCMQTASGITGGALLGAYADSGNPFFAPQTGTVQWGNFMCNFYDIDHSPNAHAVGSITDAYQRQQYIRGSKSYMLCAWNDQLITDPEVLAAIKNSSRFVGFYGLAPWKAMNYAIYCYNDSDIGKLYPCNAHYEKENTVGYNHRYPVLTSGQQAISDSWNVLKLLN